MKPERRLIGKAWVLSLAAAVLLALAGKRVSEDEWQQFLADTVTPRFPAGPTVIDVKGQWQEPGRNVRQEETKMLLGLLDAADGEELRLINKISDEFTGRFHRDPVFRIIHEVCAGLR